MWVDGVARRVTKICEESVAHVATNVAREITNSVPATALKGPQDVTKVFGIKSRGQRA